MTENPFISPHGRRRKPRRTPRGWQPTTASSSAHTQVRVRTAKYDSTCRYCLMAIIGGTSRIMLVYGGRLAGEWVHAGRCAQLYSEQQSAQRHQDDQDPGSPAAT
jgi:hypothetical protein